MLFANEHFTFHVIELRKSNCQHRYTWACTLTALVIGAAGLLSYWNISTGLLDVVFFGCIFALFLINCCGILVSISNPRIELF
jgi:hypothetical protein